MLERPAEFAEPMADICLPLLDAIAKNSAMGYIERVEISGHCTEKMIEKVCMVKSLRELKILGCRFVTGRFLGHLASKELTMLDVSHSEHMEMDEVLNCVRQNAPTLSKLKIDGESASTK
jgi:hypothetical protein